MPISVASPRSGPRLAPALRSLVRTALGLEGRRPGEIAVVLADDATLRSLNRRYRRVDRATDVLSFGYQEREFGGGDEGPSQTRGSATAGTGARRRVRERSHGGWSDRVSPSALVPSRPPGAAVCGDIVISLERMAEQAERYRVGRGEELARLVIHGALHLAGLDHHRPRARRIMRARERQAMRAGREAVRRLERVLGAAEARERRRGPRAR